RRISVFLILPFLDNVHHYALVLNKLCYPGNPGLISNLYHRNLFLLLLLLPYFHQNLSSLHLILQVSRNNNNDSRTAQSRRRFGNRRERKTSDVIHSGSPNNIDPTVSAGLIEYILKCIAEGTPEGFGSNTPSGGEGGVISNNSYVTGVPPSNGHGSPVFSSASISTSTQDSSTKYGTQGYVVIKLPSRLQAGA
ncbi:hypothetical protein L9F63_019784, partial [Diploptera punctata]